MLQQEIYDVPKASSNDLTNNLELLTVTGQRVTRLAAINQIRDYVAAYVANGNVPLAAAGVSGTVKVDSAAGDPVVYLKSTVDANFLLKTAAASLYAPASVLTTHLSKTEAANTYLTTNLANTNFLSLGSVNNVTALHTFAPGIVLGATQFVASNSKPVSSEVAPVIWFKVDDKTIFYSIGASFIGRESSETHSVRGNNGTGQRVFDANLFGVTGGVTYVDKVSVAYESYTGYVAASQFWSCEVYAINDDSSETSLIKFPLVPVPGQWSRESRDIKIVLSAGIKALGIRNLKTGTTVGSFTGGMTLTIRPYIS